MPKRIPINLEGRRFGAYTARYPTEDRDRRGHVIWVAECAHCGSDRLFSAGVLSRVTRDYCQCKRPDRPAAPKPKFDGLDERHPLIGGLFVTPIITHQQGRVYHCAA